MGGVAPVGNHVCRSGAPSGISLPRPVTPPVTYCPDTTNPASKIPPKHPVNSVVVTKTSDWRGGNFAGDW